MKTIHFILLLFAISTANAQWKWANPQNASYPIVQGQGFTGEIGKTYVRLPDRAKDKVRKPLWDLSRNSAGLTIRFYSDASTLAVRYQVAGSYAMPHMPATGVSGLDLYSIDSDGTWQRHTTGSYAFGDTARYTWNGLPAGASHKQGNEYCLYLPLYNTVKWMEIGVPEKSTVEFLPLRNEKPIVVYGTSIAQGACASRPGMAWTNIVSRNLDYPLVNLGFSGNGRLEKEVLDFVTETDACLYILDCIPNLTNRSDAELDSLIRNAVYQIRQTRTAPILLTEHASGCHFYGDKGAATRNEAARRTFDALVKEGVKGLHYLPCREINLPGDALVDYVHPTDLGMQVEAAAYEKKIREILKWPLGTSSTTRPVTQRREPGTYEWQKRHRELLAMNAAQPPQAVIIGNSITHYWGGQPAAPIQRGKASWEKTLARAGFRNSGFGYDRIENALWRVYHGELDGYQAKKVVVMLGTNNLYTNTEQEIVEGLRFLLAAIRERQPQASIRVIGILPRRGSEAKVSSVNKQIEVMAKEEGYGFADAGTRLLQKDGKINESLFVDGLHPNEEGYKKIAGKIL